MNIFFLTAIKLEGRHKKSGSVGLVKTQQIFLQVCTISADMYSLVNLFVRVWTCVEMYC